MKKFIALLLALFTLLSLVACNDETDTGTGTDSETETESQTESDTETESDTDLPTETDTDVPVDNTFDPCNETVYVVGAEALNIRSAPVVSADTVVTSKSEGTSFQRTGYNDTWSKIVIDGKEYYASSLYLSTLPPLEFEDVREVVYVKVENRITVREKAWAESTDLAYLTNGTQLVRTGVSKTADQFGSSWSRVDFADEKGNAKTGYINSAYLTTETPLAFAEVDETVIVTNCETLNVRAAADFDSAVLGTLAAKDEVKRLGIARMIDADNILWSMIEYKGGIGYVNSAYLATKAEAKTFAAGEMSIDLTADFTGSPELATVYGANYAFESEDVLVLVTRETPEALAAAGLSSNLTAEEYANLIITVKQLTGSAAEKIDDLVTFSYALMAETSTFIVTAFTYKTVDAYWQVQFMTPYDIYPAVVANIVGYAASVEFN